MSVHAESFDLPPPSQSHFAKFESFTPDDHASFDHEFSRLASSQDWIPGSQQYTQERTIAMREELKLHYFTQPSRLDDIDEQSSEDDQLRGYQSLCREVGIPPSGSIENCRKKLKNTLVNIVDLIDARRTGKTVQVWQDFEAFRMYTLQDEHRISMKEAKQDGGYLASLLQRLRGSRQRGRAARRKAGFNSRVVSGRAPEDKKDLGWN